MRVGFVSQWFPPEHGSAALPGVIAAAISDRDCAVSVVTGYPNYPQGQLQTGWRQRLVFTETIGDVTVHRTPLYISHDDRSARRILNYLSFALSAATTAVWRLRKMDVIWVHGTPALAALPAIVMRRLFGIPYVLHIQDLWPDTVLASGMLPKPVHRIAELLLGAFCKHSYRTASVIGVITPGMRSTLVSRGVPNEKIVDIPNWADESIFVPSNRDPDIGYSLGIQREFVAMYAGSMGEVQGLDTLIEAAAALMDRTDIQILLVGDGVARTRLEARARELHLDNVHFAGSRQLSEMREVLACADLQVVCLKDLPLYRITLPSKIQASLAVSRPVVVSAGGDAGAVVEDAGAGLAVPPGDAEELATAIKHIADLHHDDRSWMGAKGRSHYIEHFGQDRGVERIRAALVGALHASEEAVRNA